MLRTTFGSKRPFSIQALDLATSYPSPPRIFVPRLLLGYAISSRLTRQTNRFVDVMHAAMGGDLFESFA